MSLVKWKKKNGMFPAISSMFDNFFADDDNFFRNWADSKFLPAVNVKDTEKEYNLELAVPGMKKEDFKIEVDKGVLCISAEKEEKSEETKEDYTRKEFSFNSFSRSFWLPENVMDDKVKAEYKDGLLVLHIPKKAIVKSKAKKVKVA